MEKHECSDRREHKWIDGGRDKGRNGRVYVICSGCGVKKYI